MCQPDELGCGLLAFSTLREVAALCTSMQVSLVTTSLFQSPAMSENKRSWQWKSTSPLSLQQKAGMFREFYVLDLVWDLVWATGLILIVCPNTLLRCHPDACRLLVYKMAPKHKVGWIILDSHPTAAKKHWKPSCLAITEQCQIDCISARMETAKWNERGRADFISPGGLDDLAALFHFSSQGIQP